MAFKSRIFFTLLLLLSWLFCFSQKADNYSISVNYQAYNTNLSKVIDELNDKYGLEFSYATDGIKNVQVTAECENLSLEQALQTIFEENNIEYQIIDNKILLRVKSIAEGETPEGQSNNFIFSGKILDQSSKRPLGFVAVNIPYTSVATTSDDEGRFSLEIPNEYISDTILLQLLGYKSQKILLETKENRASLYELNPSPILLDEVTLIYRKKPLEINVTDQSTFINNSSFNGMNNTQVGADIMKTVQLLPGVAAHDDVSSDIKIRGSNSDETLVVLDGIPLYNSSHFYGIFSGINSSYVNEINLYKNSFPITYGGKTGGVVELLSSNEINSNISGEVDLNLLASSGVIDIPLGPKSKIKLSGRSTISNLSNSTFFKFSNQTDVDENLNNNLENLSRRILLNTDPKFNFQDLNTKWIFNPNQNHEISLNFYLSNDDFDNSYSNSFMGRKNQVKSTYTESFTNKEGWQNNGLSFRHQYSNEGFTFRSLAYYTKYENNATIGLELLKVSDQAPDKQIKFVNSQENFVEDKSIDISVSKQIGNIGEFQLGTNYVYHQSMFQFNEEFFSVLEGDDGASEFSQYLGYIKSFSNQWILDLGFRGSYYSKMSKYYLSPRLKLSYLVNKNFSLKASFSKYNQFLREISHENRLGQNIQFWVLAQEDAVPVSASTNFMIGTTLKLGLFDLDLEYFNKEMEGVAEHALVKPAFDPDSPPPSSREYKLFVGSGRSYGLDFMISKHTKNYQGWIAYTLSKSTNSFEEIAHGVDFPSQNDRRHQLKFINEFNFGKFNIGINYIYASGRPYTDLSLIVAESDRRNLDPNDRINFLPDYKRFDLSLKYNFALFKLNAQAGISLFNAFNNENVKYLQYIYSVPTNNQGGQGLINNVLGASTPLLSRTMNLNFKIAF